MTKTVVYFLTDLLYLSPIDGSDLEARQLYMCTNIIIRLLPPIFCNWQ
jgi:hypothetical protein